MRQIKVVLAIFLLSTLFVVVGCSSEASLIDAPDKIILYNKGKHVEFIKKDKLFAKLVKLTNERFKDNQELVTSGFGMTEDDKLIQRAAWQCMEFVYAESHEFKADGANEKLSFKYKRLFFLISADDEQDLGTEMKFGDGAEFVDSLIGLKPSSELLKIIKAEVK